MKEELNDHLFAAYLDGSLTSDEQQQFEHHASENSSLREELEAYALIWRTSPAAKLFHRIESKKNDDFENVMLRLKATHTQSREKHRLVLPSFYKIAASVTFLTMIGSAVMVHRHVPGFGRWEARATQDKIEVITLPDNTQVALNRYSRVIYLKNNDESTRKVKLTGEAFFNVASNPGKPFEIKAGETNISVLGTQFNVKLSNDKKATEVSVTEGTVKFADQNDALILHAGEIGQFNNGKLAKKSYSNTNFLYWKNKELSFHNNTLREVITILTANFEAIKEVKNTSTPTQIQVTTKFQDQSLETIFEELELHFNKKFSLKEGVLIISD
jgi:ferric-dicitrate binding protein FerR (iron transport regulator)